MTSEGSPNGVDTSSLVRIAKAGHGVKPAPAYDSNFRLLQTGSERWG